MRVSQAIILCLIFGTAHLLHAQSSKALADGFFQTGNWADAAERYERYLKGNEDQDAEMNLGKCFFELRRLEDAENIFTKLVFSPNSQAEAKYELGKVLRARGSYSKAITWLMKYAETGKDSLHAFELAAACAKAISLRKDSLGFNVVKIDGLNSPSSDISPVQFRNGIAFASARKRGFMFRFVNSANKQGFFDMYFSARSPDGFLAKPERISGRLNSRYDDGPAIFTKSENKVWITRTNLGTFKKTKDVNGINHVNVFQFDNELGKWNNGKPAPLSSLEFNIAHPAILDNGKTLVFASDMPGGFGGFDLYISFWRDSAWTSPENLGPLVNTAYNEGYPYFSSKNMLWFASDRIDGFGGKDIYQAIWKDNKCVEVWNAGFPLNSAADDFGICFFEKGANGYFSSNRAGGEGSDDIYAFKRFKAFSGTIVDSRTGQPLPNTRVEIMDINQKVYYYDTDVNGQFRHAVRVGQDVFLKVYRKDYHDLSRTISLRQIGDDEDLILDIEIEEIRKFQLLANVTEANSQAPISDAVVRIVGEKESRGFTNAKGNFEQELAPATKYRVIFFKEGYVPQIKEIETGPEGTSQQFDLKIALKKGKFRYLEGRTLDTEREVVLKNANIRILNEGGLTEKEKFELGEDGMFYKVLPDNESVSLIASKEKFLPTRIDLLDSLHANDTLLRDIEMVPLMPDKVFKIVYFPYRSSSPDEEGMRIVQEVIVLLQDNPRIGIELAAHTDSRGGAAFNKKLSQQRADALGAYIMKKGITPNRIVTLGFGEERLYNNCSDGKTCSEDLHAQNRRVEIKIVRLEEDGTMPK